MMMMQPMQPPGMPPAGAREPAGEPAGAREPAGEPACAMECCMEPACVCSGQRRTVVWGGALCSATLVVGALSVLFAHALPWLEEDDCLVQRGEYVQLEKYGLVKLTVFCTCSDDFPTYMWVVGILHLAGAFAYALAAAGCAWRQSTGDGVMSGAVTSSIFLAVAFALSAFAVTVAMSVRALRSDKECGEVLWNYGVFLLAFTCVQSCALLVAALKTTCPA